MFNVYDLLRSFQSSFEYMKANDITPLDFEYLDMYDRYIEMKSQGDKVTYIAEVLSAEDGISTRTFYKVVKRLGREL